MTTIGIPSTRVSEVFVRQQLLNQVRANQVDLYKLESELSTGHSILLPSDDPVIANRVMSIQRLQERNTQVQSNLNTSSSYLSATDSALSEVSSLMSEVRGNALSVI